MSVATSLSDPALTERPPLRVDDVRVSGGVSIAVDAAFGKSRVARVHERDGYKVRFPKRSDPPEAVVINTGGGLAAGDHVNQEFVLGPGAALTVTTQAAERVYRAIDETQETRVTVRAVLDSRAALSWLPQETILFDQSRLARSIDVDMADDARALLTETLVFGRQARGETIQNGLFRDRWRVRRGGRLVFAENVRVDTPAYGTFDNPALMNGARVAATLLLVAPDAGDRLQPIRDTIEPTGITAAASTWDDLLVVRVLARSSQAVKKLLAAIVPLTGAADVPRVWWT